LRTGGGTALIAASFVVLGVAFPVPNSIGF
jgi:hypothetical protein